MKQIRRSKQAEIKRLEREYKRLSRDINYIITKHNSYLIYGEEEQIVQWFESMPLNSLNDFCSYERGQFPDRLSLSKLEEKSKLRKRHLNKVEQLEVLCHKKSALEIEILQDKINGLLNEV